MVETTTKFAVIEVNFSNKVKYVEEFVYPSTILTENLDYAKQFPTYSKANTFAKKINKFYGYKKVKVTTINA